LIGRSCHFNTCTGVHEGYRLYWSMILFAGFDNLATYYIVLDVLGAYAWYWHNFSSYLHANYLDNQLAVQVVIMILYFLVDFLCPRHEMAEGPLSVIPSSLVSVHYLWNGCTHSIQIWYMDTS
jgi:hypothetical protein